MKTKSYNVAVVSRHLENGVENYRYFETLTYNVGYALAASIAQARMRDTKAYLTFVTVVVETTATVKEVVDAGKRAFNSYRVHYDKPVYDTKVVEAQLTIEYPEHFNLLSTINRRRKK